MNKKQFDKMQEAIERIKTMPSDEFAALINKVAKESGVKLTKDAQGKIEYESLGDEQ